ncbi:MAG: polysaccharide deacetylase 2 family uncharacterized protein YibQ [Glaciecola sp.]
MLKKITIVMLLVCVSLLVDAGELLAASNMMTTKSTKVSLVSSQQGQQYESYQQKKAQIAIIIDDIGNKRADSDAFSLPKEVTFSILPHTPFSTRFSTYSYHQGREVMLHMPMESLHGEALGDGGLLASMYPEEVEKKLLLALNSVPHATGVNNHMGSKLTQITLQMNAVMQVLNNNNLYFIDSRTTKFTKAHIIAQQHGVASAQRNVFLDHYANEAFLEKQFEQLILKARRNGSVIGIAHPYKVSISFLQHKLANLPDDIELITVSEYLSFVGNDDIDSYELPRTAKETPRPATDIAPE